MRIPLLAAAALGLLTVAASAQQPAQNGPQNPAVKSTDQNNSSMPVAGKNSFTRGEARSRIEAKGYTHLANLRKDDSGVWRAKAQKDGKSTDVTLDYQGNVN